jgi:hypothetical protein
MIRLVSRFAALFVVVGLLLTPVMPAVNATAVPIKPQADRGTLSPIGHPQPIASQAAPLTTHIIHLKSGDVVPGTPDVAALNQLARSDNGRSDNGRIHVLLQLDFIPRDLAKAEYKKSGVKLLAYVPDYAWIASVPASDPAAALSLPGVTWAGPLTVNDKLDPMIQAGEWGSWNLASDGTAAISVVMHQDETIETGRALVKSHGGQIVGEVIGIRMLMVELPQANINALAAEDAIQWIEAAEPPLREANDGIRTQIGVNTVQTAPYNLNGSGVDILIYDGGIVTATHADFSGRITVPDVASVSDHSTHVAGTAAGSGSLSAANGGSANQWRGMAPGSDIISYAYEWNSVGMLFYNNAGDIEADWAAAQNTYGADVGNASLSSNIYANYPLSCTLMGNYGVSSVLMDQIVRGGNAVVGIGDKYIATWAAGNERGSASSCGTYGTTSPPASAKNPIHVGASNTNDSSMTTFSSWGPTDDGRIKPIVVAGGEQIGGDNGIKSTIPNQFTNSSTRNCDGSGDDYCYPYDTMQGTSMASPAVAGSLALMLQQYRTTYSTSGNFWPSTAKAILMQTADDRGNAGPDYQWGFGQVRIQQAVDLIIAHGFTQANIAQGETDLYTFVVTNTAAPAQVSLAWDDYEATFNAATALINNLNLELVAPSGAVWRPWILDPANPANNATRGVNNRDNQEQVTVPTPEAGTWLVRVIGATVPQGPQDYALACDGCRAISAGVCQATLNTLPLQAPSILNGESGAFVPQTPSATPISAGEQWQRDREQGRSDVPATPVINHEESAAHTPIDATNPNGPDRAQPDRLDAALREFDPARNAGPEAVIAFADRSSDDVRAAIDSAVIEAREQIAARANPIASSSPAAPTALRVGVNGACAYNTIQEAINAATNGQTIRVADGFFGENIDINGKTLTIEGGYNATCTALVASATSRIDAVAAGSTVDISGGSVTLRNLVLGWGSSFGAGLDVLSSGQVTLDNTALIHNNGASGGGMYISSGSQVTLTNGSLVRLNTASSGGGAIMYGRLNALDTNSDLSDNCSTSDGGGVYVSGGTLNLVEADLTGNEAAGATGRGGAIFARAGSVVTLTGAVYVGDVSSFANTAYDGGGLYADDSTLNLGSSTTTLSNNFAAHYGGGVYLTNNSQLLVNGGRIGSDFASTTGNDAVLGAGVYAMTSTVSGNVRLYNNIATNAGGGLYAEASVITFTDSTIGAVGLDRQNQLGATGHEGVGLFLTNNTRAMLSNTVVSSNTFQSTSYTYGGGALVAAGSVLTLTNSRVERHLAPDTADGRGAGLYVRDATVTLDNSQIISNTAGAVGGGVRVYGGILNVTNGSSLVNNKAVNGAGGAIAATYDVSMPDVNISNATVQYNTATMHGGAIYLDAGTLDTTGWWDFRWNSAGGNGGAVAVYGTGDADFLAGGDRASYLAVNHASGDGGALYVANNDTVSLYATAGQSLNLNTNSAGGNGGAAYADNGAYFDVYGQIQATSNSAGGNGGVFYLSNGSRLWLDDYSSTRPQVWVNTADNGGAIYAVNSPAVRCDGADFGLTVNGNKATAGSGGAIYLSGSTFNDQNCIFRTNQAQAGNGGAIAAYTSTVTIGANFAAALAHHPLGLADRSDLSAPLATGCNPVSECSSFSSNRAISSTASNGYGGAIYSNGGMLSISDTYLHHNLAVRGGAIYQDNAGSIGNIANALIYSNTSQLSFGAGIRATGGSLTMTHVTIANNPGGAGYSQSSTSSSASNSIAWGNGVGGFLGTFASAVCNIDQSGNAGSVTNPQFVAAGAGENYHLSNSSPAIDACTTGLASDLDNRARPFGAGYDMGAYEFIIYRITLPIVLRN